MVVLNIWQISCFCHFIMLVSGIEGRNLGYVLGILKVLAEVCF